MIRKVYGGKEIIKDEHEEMVNRILKLPLEERKRVRDLIQTLQSYSTDNNKISEKLIETMKTGKFYKDDYDLLVKTGIIIPMEKTYKEKIEEIEKKKRMSIDEETQQELRELQKERLKKIL